MEERRLTFKPHWLCALALASTIVVSCQTKNTAEPQNTSVEKSPPSLSESVSDKVVIRLSEREQNELNVQTVAATSDVTNFKLVVPGVVYPSPSHVSIISTPVDGRISGILVQEGKVVQKGQELFKIESLVFGNLVAEFLQADAEEKFQKSRLERLRQLVEETISSKSELDRAVSDYERAHTAAIAAVAKLKAIGVPNHEIEAFKTADQIDPSLKIHAPISGSFDQLEVELGQAVEALDRIGRIIDLRKVQVKAYLSPEDAGMVALGDKVSISKRTGDLQRIEARLLSVNPGLDETNRSIVANLELEPQNNWPRPGENVRVEISTSSQGKVFSVPLKAITYDGNQAIVFVELEKGTFEKRPVEVNAIQDQYALLKNGMVEGEKVAISQVFSLKALSRYELISEE